MKDIPTSWPIVALGEVATNSTAVSGDPKADGFERYIIGRHIPSDGDQVATWGQVGDSDFGPRIRTIFQPGDVICTTRGPNLKVARVDFRGLGAHTNFVLRTADSDVLVQPYLEAIARSDGFQRHLTSSFRGSVNLFVNWSDAAKYEFALPPVGEQRRRVAVLSAMTAVTESTELLRLRLHNVEQAFLLDTFGPRPGVSPRGTQVVLLGALAEVRTGLAIGRKPDASTTTRPYLRVANVKDGGLDLSDMKDIVVDSDKISRYSLQHGDVLMTEGGDLDKLGRGTVWQDELPGCLHQNHVFAVRANRERLDPWYLAALARSRYGRTYFLSCAKRTSNLASINKQQVGAFPIPLISMKEQLGWVATYRALLESRAAIEERLDTARKHRDVLRNDLIGRLR